MSDNKLDFEKAIRSLEKIIEQLENNECSLDESIKLFENGVELINVCKSSLKNAQDKINAITQTQEGNISND